MRAFSRTSAMSSSRIRPATRGVYAAPPTPDGGLWTGLPAGGTPQGGPAPGPRRQDGLMTFSDPVDTQVSGPGPVPARTEEPTIGALVHDLTQQLPELIRSEMRLAQAEVTEKGKRAGLGIGMFSVAGLLAFFGVAGADDHRDPGARPGPARLAGSPHRGGRAVRRCRRGGAGRQEAGEPGDPAQAREGDRGPQGRHRDREGSHR